MPEKTTYTLGKYNKPDRGTNTETVLCSSSQSASWLESSLASQESVCSYGMCAGQQLLNASVCSLQQTTKILQDITRMVPNNRFLCKLAEFQSEELVADVNNSKGALPHYLCAPMWRVLNFDQDPAHVASGQVPGAAARPFLHHPPCLVRNHQCAAPHQCSPHQQPSHLQ